MPISPSPFAQIQDCCPEAEIWWDSPPQVFPDLVAKLLSSAPSAKEKQLWAGQLNHLLDVEHPERSLVKGVTTNPSLISKWIQDDGELWKDIIVDKYHLQRSPTIEATFQLVYQEAIRYAAQAMLPLWEASGGRYGWVSGQTDPRIMFNTDALVRQGQILASLSPNVMVKVAGTDQGYDAIRQLTAQGISTNSTLSYTVPQFVACIRAVEDGLAQAAVDGVDTSRWRNVITHMIGRFGSMNTLAETAKLRGIDLSTEDIRYAEIAILKKALETIDRKGHPVKMLLSSLLANDTPMGASDLSMHLEHTTGAPVIYTCKPDFVAEIVRRQNQMPPLRPNMIVEPIPDDVMDRLNQLPTFCNAIDPDGIHPRHFSSTGPFLGTFKEVNENVLAAIDYVAHQVTATDGAPRIPVPMPAPTDVYSAGQYA